MNLKRLYVPLLVILASVGGFFVGYYLAYDPQHVKLDEIKDLIRSSYWKGVDTKILEEGSIEGMLSKLDQYCQYFTQGEWKEYQIELKGEYVGVGIEVSLDSEGFLNVVSPIEDTPAFRSNILTDDKIIAIDGVEIKGITLEQAISKIRGKPGTKVRLRIVRARNKPFDVELTREVIKRNSVKHRILEDGVGYIKISQFNEQVVVEFDKAVDDLLKLGMKKMVLDLRFNPGGMLTECVQLTDRFIKDGKIVVIQSRHDSYEEKAKKGDKAEDIPVVVLINKGSASASEILAGAIKDHKRGLLVGERTYGKGTVQTFFSMGDGSRLKLTTGHYLTPLGKRIERGKGIDPDHVVELTEEEALKIRGSTNPEDDKQFKKALDLLK